MGTKPFQTTTLTVNLNLTLILQRSKGLKHQQTPNLYLPHRPVRIFCSQGSRNRDTQLNDPGYYEASLNSEARTGEPNALNPSFSVHYVTKDSIRIRNSFGRKDRRQP